MRNGAKVVLEIAIVTVHNNQPGLGITLDPERLRVRGRARVVLSNASEIGVMLRPEVVNAQDGLVVADLGDADAASRGLGHQQLIMPVPFESQREVAVRHRTQHGDSLAETQMLTHCELIDGGWH